MAASSNKEQVLKYAHEIEMLEKWSDNLHVFILFCKIIDYG